MAHWDEEIRNNPNEFGLEKITENSLSSAIKRLPKWQKMTKAILEARKAYNILTAANRAIQEKGANLNNLVKLHGQQYFTGPPKIIELGERVKTFQGKLNEGAQAHISRGLSKLNHKKKG
jgi:hypothetical protein